MILIGQFDSPFVRRVGIALRTYGMAFDHRPWSAFGDTERIAAYNPLTRVPTLVLDTGEALIDSTIILDHLDELAGPARAMIPDHGHVRREALKVCALALGAADKAVSLLYEKTLHEQTSPMWVDRCRAQIGAVLDILEADRAGRQTTWWFGEHLGHADVAVACLHRFLREVHTDLVSAPASRPRLTAHAHLCEALPVFREISQPFSPPRA